MPKLSRAFYERDTKKVAKELLGKKLVRVLPNGTRLSGIIVETEAYLGEKDKAAHTFGGRRTPRTETMFGPAGLAYIYFIYGMHFCLNAVTQREGMPQAVLIRALECVEGLSRIKKNRRKILDIKGLANGPGKLCEALQIDKSLNGVALDSDTLFIEDTPLILRAQDRVITTRIGVAYAGDAALWPLRYYIKGNAFISRK